jgi:hypothetical protein
MSQTRPTQTKALNAYLATKHTSLSAAIAMVGLDQEAIIGATISDDIVGRIARLRGITPEQLKAFAAPFATA